MAADGQSQQPGARPHGQSAGSGAHATETTVVAPSLLRQNLPNWLTTARVVMAVAFFAILTFWKWDGSAASRGESDWVLLAAAITFIVAGLTDIADGYLARRWQAESSFGRIMDPFADKILVVGGFVFLAGPDFWWTFPAGSPSRISGHGIQISGVYPWMVVVILGRELLVTSIRGVLEAQGIKFPADAWGKVKMFAQSVAIPTALILTAVTPVLPPIKEAAQYRWLEASTARQAIDLTVWVMMFFTVASGLPYVTRAARLLAERKAQQRAEARA